MNNKSSVSKILEPHINSLCIALDIHPDSINGGVIRAAFVAAARAPQAGWVMVPKEPTLEMLEAAIDCTHDANTDTWGHYWQAMLAAAPSPTGEKE